MTIARNHHLFLSEPTYFHLISRCVRRAYLCGNDPHSGTCYDHRKRWLEKRLFALSDLFFVDLYGYAIMSNHYHLVVCTRPDEMIRASDQQIAQRWCRLFPHRALPESERVRSLCADQTSLALYRQRLCDISWLMRCMNEGLARQANKEDACTGRFWQGRFRSQLLLDETAVYTCMAYVDLNPVRAGIASTPLESKYTSITYRIAHHSGAEGLCALNNRCARLAIGLADYLCFVNETARYIQGVQTSPDPKMLSPMLTRLKINELGYMKSMQDLSRLFYRAIGSMSELRQLSDRLNLKWVKGQSASKQLYG